MTSKTIIRLNRKNLVIFLNQNLFEKLDSFQVNYFLTQTKKTKTLISKSESIQTKRINLKLFKVEAKKL